MSAPVLPFSLAAWAAWAPGLNTPEDWAVWASGGKTSEGETKPDLPFVDAMTRRRLSPLSRMSLWAAHQALGGRTGIASVFASRHGELPRSAELLAQLAAGEPLSPMGFSLSVHNTASGLHSIVARDTAPSTAIAGGADSLTAGLLEALGRLAENPAAPVLLVYGDDRMPEVYGEFDSAKLMPHALALLLSSGDTHRLSLETGAIGEAERECQSLELLRTLACGGAARLGDWRWQGA
ncbi:MAG: beta-ketoacyl synthase chain length factor [Gammaproteobacteria bacterium]|nr:beta-ketoacyl synthase chain length factor [Gammaproteobacteria bacterium]